LLIKVLLKREVPSGGRSYDVGAVVQNIATLVMLGRLLPLGQGLIERVVTITGEGVKQPVITWCRSARRWASCSSRSASWAT